MRSRIIVRRGECVSVVNGKLVQVHSKADVERIILILTDLRRSIEQLPLNGTKRKEYLRAIDDEINDRKQLVKDMLRV